MLVVVLQSQHLGGRGKWILEFKTSIIYRMSSRMARAAQINLVLGGKRIIETIFIFTAYFSMNQVQFSQYSLTHAIIQCKTRPESAPNISSQQPALGTLSFAFLACLIASAPLQVYVLHPI